MSYFADIIALIAIVDKLLVRQGNSKALVNDAISAISKAWNYTYDYLRNHKGEFVANQLLSDLWNDAAAKARLVDTELASQLQDKSRFWIHPDLPRQKHILLLTEITDEIERLKMKLK